MNQMNLTEFAHVVGLALGHYGAREADPRMVSQAIFHDDLAAYAGLTAATRLLDPSIPMAQAGFRPFVVDGELAYGHRTETGRLTVDLFPDSRTATMRFEAGGGKHILSLDVVFADGTVYTCVQAGDLSLLDGRPDRLSLLQRIDQQCGGRIRRALEAEIAGPVYDAGYVAGVQRLLDALDMVGAEDAGV